MLRHPFLQTMLVLIVLSSASSCESSRSTLVPTGTPVQNTVTIPTVVPPPANTSTPTLPPTSTFPALPGPYLSQLLNPLDIPHTYLADTCQYLYDKWAPGKSAPGTVVMVIMFHKITNEMITNPSQISEYNFRRLMASLHQDGFQAVTTLQLDGFLEHNSKIPLRSVLLVTDDKHAATYFDVLFRPYWVDYGWPVVNAWVSDDLTTEDNWKQQEDLNAAGWVDYQAHGVVSDPITPNSTDTYILNELKGPFVVFQEHFNKTPAAIIWPGGGFTPQAAGVARRLGYRLGFTINPRGPLMFNWVPLADNGDPARPTWIQEGPVNDPLMVLPRYWDTDASLHLNDVIQIGQAAADYAWANKSTELDYYKSVCSSAFEPLP